ncbi:MAG: discoidin domain-containing protein [Sulfuriferula sp.]
MKRIAVIFFFALVSCSLAGPVQHIKNMLKARRALKQTTATSQGMVYPAWESATMTASNTPSPVNVSASSQYDASYVGWKAFDQSLGSRWQTGNGVNYPHWLLYDCGENNSNVMVMFTFNPYAAQGLKNFTIDYSQDNSTWVTGVLNTVSDATWVCLTNADPLAFYRYFKISGLTGFANNATIYEMTFSSADYENPQMAATNNPAIYNIACDGIINSAYDAWYAFNKMPNTGEANHWWNTGSGAFPHWISFMFETNTVINGFTLMQYTGRGMSNIEFQASLDYSTWVTCSTHVAYDTTALLTYTNGNTTAYKYYKLYGTNGVDMANKNWGIWEIKLKHYR